MSVNILNFFQSSHTLQYLSPVLTVQVYIVQFNYCIVCCLYVYKSYFIQKFIVYMRCIFPCLQLIYFYMGVEYLMLCFSFALGSQDWRYQCCTANALLRQTDTEHRQRQKNLVYDRTRLAFLKRGVILFKNTNKQIGQVAFCKSVLLNSIFL